MSVRFVTHPQYDLGLLGIEKLHPFDTKKYSRALALAQSKMGAELNPRVVQVDRPASDEELALVHSEAYLQQLKKSRYIANILELPPVALVPNALVDKALMYPMRLATRGTIIAAELALKHGRAVNFAGGYHHAKPDSGEGFCLYNDIAIAIRSLRQSGKLGPAQTVLYVDLDVHQGNGVATAFLDEPSVKLFDMFGGHLGYPQDPVARQRVDHPVLLSAGLAGPRYIGVLQSELKAFVAKYSDVGLCVYNAGTDIFEGDPLGQLRVAESSVLLRDRFVFEVMASHDIPCVMLPSGGYTDDSHRLISNTVCALLKDA